MIELLNPAEWDRCQAFRVERDRANFVLATAVTRLAASDLLRRLPHLVDLRRHCTQCGRGHGRPTLPGSGWHVSISHSDRRIAVALSREAEVGLDVERARSLNYDDLASCVLGAGERAASSRDFLAYWTRKEAVVKATGDGLQVPLTEVLVSPPTDAPRLLSYPQRDVQISMVDLSTCGPYVATIAVNRTREPVIVQRNAKDLLQE